MDLINSLLALDLSGEELSSAQMAARACVIYFFSLFLLKIGNKRFMGQNSALDIVLMIILGSVASRAINGSAAFVPTLVACLVLVLIHRVVSWLASRSKFLARYVEGRSTILVEDGQIRWDALKRHHVTEADLDMAVRQALNRDDFAEVKDIYLERNGKFNVVKK